MKRLRHIIIASTIAFLGLVVTPLAAPVTALDVFTDACSSTGNGGGTGTTGTTGQPAAGSGSSGSICGAAQSDDASSIITNVINTLFMVLGMIAVIMIVIGGIRYATSGGDSSQTKAAKDTILYAVVGLIVAIMSYAIVNFVLERLKG
jgi:hypothetical protein